MIVRQISMIYRLEHGRENDDVGRRDAIEGIVISKSGSRGYRRVGSSYATRRQPCTVRTVDDP